MSEAIRRHDLRRVGGQVVRTEFDGKKLTAVLAYLELSAAKRAAKTLRQRGWSVSVGGLSIKAEVDV